MSRFFDLVSKPARDMGAANAPGTSTAAQVKRSPLIKLDSNESPFGPSVHALDAMRSAMNSANLYPDDDCSPLRAKLAAHHGLPAEQVLVTAGSTGLLSLLCQTLLAPGLNAVTSERSFIVYSMAVQAAGGRLIEVPMRENNNEDSFDLDAVLGAIDANTRIVFLANPNNPTGTMFEAAVVEQFLTQLPAHVVLVLDEAYYEFALHFASLRRVNYSNSLDYVHRGASVVVLRTFSKAHGLAGLRVGYGLGPAELLGYCARMRNTFSVSSVAQAAAIAALDDQEHIQRVVENNTIQSRDLAQGLAALGFRVVPTWANFVFCDLGEDAADFAGRLQEEGVAVRPLGSWGAPNCIRVTIGRAEQNQAFLKAAQRARSNNPPAGPGASPTVRSVM
ncbi:MAG TPA: histidinol-phosphate transaminase [Candidatus Aquilonibacter sp.]|jgi:histidinol-phosphate aminotransferase|nr:histidinol-phosphate transaminase [Candidatus Aquilonibacter sp.]